MAAVARWPFAWPTRAWFSAFVDQVMAAPGSGLWAAHPAEAATWVLWHLPVVAILAVEALSSPRALRCRVETAPLATRWPRLSCAIVPPGLRDPLARLKSTTVPAILVKMAALALMNSLGIVAFALRITKAPIVKMKFKPVEAISLLCKAPSTFPLGIAALTTTSWIAYTPSRSPEIKLLT